jgi:hypothetical protein
MSILNSKIKENDKAAAESSQPSPFQPQSESTLSAVSSTHEPPESPALELPTPIEESPVANTNGKNDKAELSRAQSDIPMDSAEAPDETLDEAEKEEVNKSSTTEQQKVQVPTSSQTTTSEPDEIIVPNLSSPQALVHKILQIDGRMPNSRTANAWKEIRCYRNNQDMGSLFDVREAWFLQHGLLEE